LRDGSPRSALLSPRPEPAANESDKEVGGDSDQEPEVEKGSGGMNEGMIPVPLMFELTDAAVLDVPAAMIGEPDRMGREDLLGVTGGEESPRSPGLGFSEPAAARRGLCQLDFVADHDPGRFLQAVPGGEAFLIPGVDLEVVVTDALDPSSVGGTMGKESGCVTGKVAALLVLDPDDVMPVEAADMVEEGGTGEVGVGDEPVDPAAVVLHETSNESDGGSHFALTGLEGLDIQVDSGIGSDDEGPNRLVIVLGDTGELPIHPDLNLAREALGTGLAPGAERLTAIDADKKLRMDGTAFPGLIATDLPDDWHEQ